MSRYDSGYKFLDRARIKKVHLMPSDAIGVFRLLVERCGMHLKIIFTQRDESMATDKTAGAGHEKPFHGTKSA